MSPDFPEIGVGYAFDEPDPLNDWMHYWTQAFGHPVGHAFANPSGE